MTDVETHLANAAENELRRMAQEDAAGIKAMAEKLAPRSTPDLYAAQARGQQNVSPVGMQKRSMSPNEHFMEALASLQKTLDEAHSLRKKILGPTPETAKPKSIIDNNAEPVAILLHKQAQEVARLASEITAALAQVRDAL